MTTYRTVFEVTLKQDFHEKTFFFAKINTKIIGEFKILVHIFRKISPAAGRNTEIDDLHFEIGTWKKTFQNAKKFKKPEKKLLFYKKVRK